MKTCLNVILVGYTPEPESTVSAAARLCYSSANVENVVSKMRDGRTNDFLEKIISMGHMSPLEHASFTFAIEGISRACSHQLVRHRLASYSQQSQRYVGKEEGFDYIVPPAIRDNVDLKTYYIDLMEMIGGAYQHFVKRLMEKGRSKEEACEDARFVLPNAAETKIIVSMNARELLHFFKQRLCMRAQWEIREMAIEMLRLVKKVAPYIFIHAGPPCINGKCPEGRFSCGRAEEVRKFLRNLKADDDKNNEV